MVSLRRHSWLINGHPDAGQKACQGGAGTLVRADLLPDFVHELAAGSKEVTFLRVVFSCLDEA